MKLHLTADHSTTIQIYTEQPQTNAFDPETDKQNYILTQKYTHSHTANTLSTAHTCRAQFRQYIRIKTMRMCWSSANETNEVYMFVWYVVTLPNLI